MLQYIASLLIDFLKDTVEKPKAVSENAIIMDI